MTNNIGSSGFIPRNLKGDDAEVAATDVRGSQSDSFWRLCQPAMTSGMSRERPGVVLVIGWTSNKVDSSPDVPSIHFLVRQQALRCCPHM
jgi:hypothetical protein